ncbi:helix-turn-helix domain-containing protein [Spirochaeta isovalerica]|uniref:helix-turn-helix domain-containing protein n=1 Tax=Spirochaeta isovalerica TaxID=150 RepID=UPI003CCE1AA6
MGTPSYIYQLVSARKLKFYKTGRRVLFLEKDLDDFMESNVVTPIGYQIND